MFDESIDHECTHCGEPCDCHMYPCEGCSLCADDFDVFDIDGDPGDENDYDIEWEE